MYAICSVLYFCDFYFYWYIFLFHAHIHYVLIISIFNNSLADLISFSFFSWIMFSICIAYNYSELSCKNQKTNKTCPLSSRSTQSWRVESVHPKKFQEASFESLSWKEGMSFRRRSLSLDGQNFTRAMNI